MFKMQDLNSLLLDKEVSDNIIKDCQSELEFALNLQIYVEGEMLVKMNEIDNPDKNEGRINQAIFMQFAQAIKSFKSCILLATDGYFPNALMNLRNIAEIVFNIKYILEDPSQKVKRANDYMTIKDFWTDASIKDRAFFTLDQPLYKAYKILCNYSHASYMGTGQNYDGKSISINPSEEKVKNTIGFINSLYYYLIRFINEYYSFKSDFFDSIQLPEDFSKFIEFYDTEKDVVDFFFGMLAKEVGLSEEQKAKWIRDFTKFTTIKKKRKK